MLTAYRAGLKTVIIPKRNSKELVEIPKRVRRSVRMVLAEEMGQVLAEALLPDFTPQ
jgi:ATP-dependent Lon protease